MRRQAFCRSAIALLVSVLPFAASAADDYPSRAITLVVPFPAGSATDGTARRIATELSRVAKVPVVVDNKPGADGNVAATAVLRGEADGYSVFVTTNSTHAANVNLFRSMPFDPKADFVPVTGIAKIPMIVAVRADHPSRNIREFMAFAKNAPKPVTFGTGSQTGRGAGEMLKEREKLSLLNVPYKGSPQAITDLLGGHIDALFGDPVSTAGMVANGSIRVLAVTSASRAATMPNVPTLAESGLPGFDFVAWIGAFAKAGTPPAVVAKLNSMITAVLAEPAIADAMKATGATPFPTTSEQLAAFAEADTKRWAQIVQAAKMEKQ